MSRPNVLRAVRVLAACAALSVFAGSSRAAVLPAQGALRNAGSGPVADGNYLIVVSIYDAADAQLAVVEEIHKTVEVKYGAFELLVGGIKGIPEELLTSGKALWIGLQVGADPELPRVPLRAVSRAWFAEQAASATLSDTAKDLACTACVDGAELAPGSVEAKHVAFTYAGSSAKGGAAGEALHANEADHAKNSDAATEASHAANADKAKAADTATNADAAAGLNCTGCVGLAQLDATVKSSWLPLAGGTVTGKVTMAQGLDLANTTLAGARIAELEVGKTTCDAGLKGLFALGSDTANLHFCTAQGWRKLKMCAGTCSKPVVVACGQPIPDDCGDIGGCTGTGSYCGAGATCLSGSCATPGQVPETAGANCADILLANSKSTSGVYYINPIGGPATNAYKVHCDMTTDGGGWTLVASFTDPNKWAAANAIWHDTGVDAGPVTPTAPGKSQAYLNLPGTQILFKTHAEADGYWASFTLPGKGTIGALVGTTNIASRPDGYLATVAKAKQGTKAHACWAQDWRVTWKNYWSADNYPDSAIFAPSGASSSRPCGGSGSYATGIGVRTDSNNGFDGYGASFEGYGNDGSGNPALTNGYTGIYVR